GSSWTAAKLRLAREILIEFGLIQYDSKTGEVLIERWWKDCPPNNPDWITGARRNTEAIQSPELRRAALDALNVAIGAQSIDRDSPQVFTQPTANISDERLRLLHNK